MDQLKLLHDAECLFKCAIHLIEKSAFKGHDAEVVYKTLGFLKKQTSIIQDDIKELTPDEVPTDAVPSDAAPPKPETAA